MPVKDFFHDLVVRALLKAGWNVPMQQFLLGVGKRRLWIDLQADGPQGEKVLIEVKGFDVSRSPIDYLESALGQYVLYTGILKAAQLDMLLYMAVPEAAVQTGILSEKIGRIAIQSGNIRLLLFRPASEEIVAWIP
jgi:hypothetical protein